jgi:hypothetical protein
LPIKNKNGLVTLKGIIIPVDWDNKGNASAIAISTHGEQEYIICKDKKGKKLFNFVHDSVQVRGKIVEAAGIKAIKIDDVERYVFDIPKLKKTLNSSKEITHAPGRND